MGGAAIIANPLKGLCMGDSIVGVHLHLVRRSVCIFDTTHKIAWEPNITHDHAFWSMGMLYNLENKISEVVLFQHPHNVNTKLCHDKYNGFKSSWDITRYLMALIKSYRIDYGNFILPLDKVPNDKIHIFIFSGNELFSREVSLNGEAQFRIRWNYWIDQDYIDDIASGKVGVF